ncbi:serine hydrolase [Clostridium sp. MCC353]|uniref:serine hydrolase domain-containing protein n=1 Tax=Clostridium sp. MCC353 TaxID=2592646 RepID=UPI001C029B33|nr:serine hydrolase domain-containing protein [Clostridium sp. MCC353]MBT9778571.1 serine hydrolase [Clostridium sp. MCC353]
MDFTELTAYLTNLTKKAVPSCACLIYLKNKEIYRHYAGYSRIDTMSPVKDDTLYRLYSITKLYTAAAVLTLYERGLLSLNADVSQFIPQFAHMHVMRTRRNGMAETVLAERPVTIWNLLTMQSGLPYCYNNPGAAIWKSGKIMEEFRSRRGFYTTREYAEMLAGLPLPFEPGTQFLYGACYDVLAAVVEIVTGMAFGEYLESRILSPMKIRNTAFKIHSQADWHRLAGIYKIGKDGCFIEAAERNRQYCPENPFEEGGGGLLATIDDCMKFMLMLQNKGLSADGVRILREDSVRMMSENQLDTAEKLEDFGFQFGEWGKDSPYGYGMGVRVRLREDGCKDSPAGEFGWYGMCGNYVLIDPQNQLTVVYMQQTVPGREKEIHPELRKIIYRSIW